MVLPGYLYHVTQRGNYRQFIYDEDKDRVIYLKLIQEYSREYGVEIFAYCLMDNHIHFIVRPKIKNALTQAFCRAHQRYSYYYHQKHKIRGHLWQERFYSCMLFGEHIKRAIRYVERNPVRARMVGKAWDYPWSSARAHLGKEYKIIKLADVGEYINVSSWKHYLLEDESSDDLRKIRESTFRGLVFGPLEFIRRLEKTLQQKIIPKPRGRPKMLVK